MYNALYHERKERNDYESNKNRRLSCKLLFGRNDKRDNFMRNILG